MNADKRVVPQSDPAFSAQSQTTRLPSSGGDWGIINQRIHWMDVRRGRCQPSLGDRASATSCRRHQQRFRATLTTILRPILFERSSFVSKENKNRAANLLQEVGLDEFAIEAKSFANESIQCRNWRSMILF
jgi:hypothetical protein